MIFDENVSFDHYFGTYPFAPNLAGEPVFHARPGTPTVNGLYNSGGPVGPVRSAADQQPQWRATRYGSVPARH